MAVLRQGSLQRPMSEINVTPFVDVMLVLLIIFMVTAPMMQQGIDVDLPGTATVQQHWVTIKDGTFATVAPQGVLHTGTDRGFLLESDTDPNELYLMAASLSSTTGVPTCGGTLPLDYDAIMNLSLSNAAFQGFFGTLDHAGKSLAPSLALPADPNLSGTQLYFAYAVVDMQAACPVRNVSTAQQMTIL